AWYLLGSVRKFDEVGKGVEYEMAGVKLRARRTSTEPRAISVIADADGAELRSHLTATGLLFTTISDAAPTFEEYFPDLEPLLAT
ncbi:hypothetical protein LTS18_014285, partial [Coniosporium uncinatum]